MTWNAARWPNFSVKELQCKCGCGLFIQNDYALDNLQTLRNMMDAPLRINSATRCVEHNKTVKGSPNSKHLDGMAFDIALDGHDPARLYRLAKLAHFTGFGFGSHFLHVDTGRERHWDYGPASLAAWAGVNV